MKRFAVLLAIVVVLSGQACFTSEIPQQAYVLNLEWYDSFNDSYLSDYIREALVNNPQIRKVDIELEKFNSRLCLNKQRYFPVINLNWNSSKKLYSIDPYNNGNYKSRHRTDHSGALNFELPVGIFDLRTTRKLNAKDVQQLNTILFQRKAAALNLVKDVSETYYKILETDVLIDIQNNLILNLENQNFIKQSNIKLGLASKNDDFLINKKLNQEKFELCRLESERNNYLQHLKLLMIRRNTADFKRNSLQNVDFYKKYIPEEICSEEVYNRPDMLISQSEILEAKIDIDIAKLAFCPKIKLFGEYGFLSFKLNEFLEKDKIAYNFGGDFLQTLFDAGQKRKFLAEKKYNYQKLLEDYYSTMFNGLTEIENSLYTVKKKDLSTIEIKKTMLDNSAKALSKIKSDYECGLKSKLDVLATEEEVLRAKKEYYSEIGQLAVDMVSIYVSVGGNIKAIKL